MSKQEMLRLMRDNCWNHSLTIENSVEEVQKEFDSMIEEFNGVYIDIYAGLHTF